MVTAGGTWQIPDIFQARQIDHPVVALEKHCWFHHRCFYFVPIDMQESRATPPYKAGVPVVEIQAKEVPDRTKRQIYSKASHLKIRRPRRAPKPTGMLIVDLIRERAFSKGYTMAELDEWVGRLLSGVVNPSSAPAHAGRRRF